MVYIESLCFYYETKKYSDNLKMQNKKCLKNKMFLTCHGHFFSKSIRILRRPKWKKTPPGIQFDARYVQPRFENSPCCAWSIRRDVGQVLHRQTFPCSMLRCTSRQGAGPRFGWNKPIYLYSRCYENCLCRVTSL